MTLRAIRPNVGLEHAYRAKIDRLIDEMHRSVRHWVLATYRQNEPLVAVELARDDAIPSDVLMRLIQRLARRWTTKFNDASKDLAKYFATAASERTDAQLKSALKKAGISIKFELTRAQRDILSSVVSENVSLIKSIQEQYLTQVEGHVMRSVQTGRDIGYLAQVLEEQFGVTSRRAAFIARDQNNKATSALTEARRAELGIAESIWMHSGGGKHPRPKHVAADGRRYPTGVGLPIGDKGQTVLPGMEPGCRCVSKSILPDGITL